MVASCSRALSESPCSAQLGPLENGLVDSFRIVGCLQKEQHDRRDQNLRCTRSDRCRVMYRTASPAPIECTTSVVSRKIELRNNGREIVGERIEFATAARTA